MIFPHDRSRLRIFRYGLIMLLGVLFNLFFHHLALVWSLPMWLDYCGTVLCAIVLETSAGLLVGLVNNFIEALSANSPSLIIYYGVSASIAIISGVMMRKNGKLCWKRIPITAVSLVLVSGILSTLLTFWQAKGVLTLEAEIYFRDAFFNKGFPTWLSTFFGITLVKVFGVVFTGGIVGITYALLPKWLKHPHTDHQQSSPIPS